MIIELKEYLNKIVGVDMQLEVASDDKFGDYATNVAFGLGKEYKKAPMVIAQELVEKIKLADVEKVFENVSAAAPGFINFKIKKEYLVESLNSILERDEIASSKTSRNDGQGSKKKKINLEFVSGNPTGPLTMANSRGGFLGDVLANVFESVGYEVTREYYINDAGAQIKKLGESVLSALDLAPKSDEHYQGEYITELAGKHKTEIVPMSEAESGSRLLIGNQNVGTSNALAMTDVEVGKLIAKDLLGQIKTSLERVGIKFDEWFSENDQLRGTGAVDDILKKLKTAGVVYEADGVQWLRSTDGGDDKDRVLIKTNGEPTYILPDIAYHYNKLVVRKFDEAINIWGADHYGDVARLMFGIKSLGIDEKKLKIILVQFVRLIKDGVEFKMSKRKGNFVTLDDLVDEVGADATRFFFLMHSADSHMDFDLGLAKEKSSKNPVYYAQYAFTRAHAILEKAKIQITNFSPKGGSPSGRQFPISNAVKNYKFETEDELRLIRQLVQLPDVLNQTAEDYQVNRLTRYAGELASAFHNFYEKERAITDNAAETEMRLALVAATKTILERLFKILGITAREKM